MALRGTKPVVKNNRLKLFMYGNAKVGKTTLALQFPKPYVIDTEGTTDKKKYVELINKGGGDVFVTQDFEELVQEVKDLLTLKHDFKTLVIDSFTIPYNDLLDKSALALGTDFGRHYELSNRKCNHLINLLLRLDMNVIITSHSKNLYGDKLQILGSTFDCYKKLDYIFDLIIEIQKRGKDRVTLIKGTRLEEFEESTVFPCSYEEFSKRYSEDCMERTSTPQEIEQLSEVVEILRLIDLLKVPSEIYQKWLDKSGSESWEEMPKESIQKCIDHLKSKIQGE